MLKKGSSLGQINPPTLAFDRGMGFDVKVELSLTDMNLFNVTTFGLSTSVKHSSASVILS